MEQNEENRCPKCMQINTRKKLVECGECGKWYHLTCVGLTRVQADTIPIWNCLNCRGVITINPHPVDFDLLAFLARCKGSVRVLPKVPKGATIHVADALDKLLRQTLESRTPVAWGRH